MTSLEIINEEIEQYEKAKQRIYDIGKNSPDFDIEDHIEDLEKSIQGIITEKILEQDFKKTYATIVKPQDVLKKD